MKPALTRERRRPVEKHRSSLGPSTGGYLGGDQCRACREIFSGLFPPRSSAACGGQQESSACCCRDRPSETRKAPPTERTVQMGYSDPSKKEGESNPAVVAINRCLDRPYDSIRKEAGLNLSDPNTSTRAASKRGHCEMLLDRGLVEWLALKSRIPASTRAVCGPPTLGGVGDNVDDENETRTCAKARPVSTSSSRNQADSAREKIWVVKCCSYSAASEVRPPCAPSQRSDSTRSRPL